MLSGLDGAAGTPGAVLVAAISGMAGVGKTALALHWAHQAARRFADGQLYVNLRGFDPCAAPVAPEWAIRGFLEALHISPERIPASPDARAGLYRTLLAGKRMLIVLDNARDEEHVRPLLPASSTCLVVVTSRNQLPGLVAGDGAQPVSLDVLSEAESRELLAHRLGTSRTAAEPQAVTELVRLCARLPLALTIIAARAAIYSGRPLAALAAELRDQGGLLAALDTGEPTTSVQAVFSWSYQDLRPAAARMFRLLGLHPSPDVTVPAAANLAGVPEEVARRARPGCPGGWTPGTRGGVMPARPLPRRPVQLTSSFGQALHRELGSADCRVG
jgi:NB-ARC domain